MKKIIRTLFVFLSLACCLAQPAFSEDKIRVVTTTSTFASLAKTITGDQADIYFIASPNRDIHFISPSPKDVLKMKKADVFIHAGLDLEVWRGPLLDAVGRAELMEKGNRSINVSEGISLLEVPANLSRSEGDIHLFGNPHYWTDPENGKIIALNITDGLTRIYPERAESFKRNADQLLRKIDEKTAEWKARMKPYAGAAVVTYHNSWPYFMQRFDLKDIGHIEPKAGIAPTPKHLRELIEKMKAENARAIVKEVFRESRTPNRISKETVVPVVTLFQEVGEKDEDYLDLIEKNIRELEKAFDVQR